jgi:hypothetical protein
MIGWQSVLSREIVEVVVFSFILEQSLTRTYPDVSETIFGYTANGAFGKQHLRVYRFNFVALLWIVNILKSIVVCADPEFII